MYRRERRERGRMKGIKREERKAGKRRITAGEEGLFRGEKGLFHPSSEEFKREERGAKGVKKLYLAEG